MIRSRWQVGGFKSLPLNCLRKIAF